MTIHNFRQLQELELPASCPSSVHEALLSSIASTELRKVIFQVRYTRDWGVLTERMDAWALVDQQLCRLVDRLHARGYRHTLEVELRLAKVGGDPGGYKFTKFLPEFREKGLVAIMLTDAAYGYRILHSSTYNHQS